MRFYGGDGEGLPEYAAPPSPAMNSRRLIRNPQGSRFSPEQIINKL
jgi:hypothetical protein